MSNKNDLLNDLVQINKNAETQARTQESQKESLAKLFDSTVTIDDLVERESANRKSLSKRVREVKSMMDELGIKISLIGEKTEREEQTLKNLRIRLKAAQTELSDFENAGFFKRLFSDDKDTLVRAVSNAEKRLQATTTKINDAVEERMNDPKVDNVLQNTMTQIEKFISVLSSEKEIITQGIDNIKNAQVEEKERERVIVDELTETDKLIDDATAKEFEIRQLISFEEDESKMTQLHQDLQAVVENLATLKNSNTSNTSLLEKSRAASIQFRNVLGTANEALELQNTMIKSLKAQKLQNETLYEQRVNIQRTAQKLNISLKLDDHLTKTAQENAEHLALTTKVLADQSLDVMSKATTSREHLTDLYKETKSHVSAIEEKMEEHAKNTRKNFSLDV